MKLKITFLIVCALLLGAMPGFGQDLGGNIGTSDLTWTLSLGGTLTISGTGAMPDNVRPWAAITSPAITAVVIEEGVTSIGELAFSNCLELVSVDLATSLTSIGASTFLGCSQLSSIDLKQVGSIGEWAFAYCGLTSITIPATVTSIGDGAFGMCRSLATVEVVSGNPSYYVVEDNVLYDAGKTILLSYSAAKADQTFTVPGTVETIGGGAFNANNQLTAVEIPASVKKIGNDAFSNCRLLISVLRYL